MFNAVACILKEWEEKNNSMEGVHNQKEINCNHPDKKLAKH
jgi:hypothetical protein